MTFDVEIMLRGNERVFTERLACDREPADWADADVAGVLTQVLQTIDRVQASWTGEPRPVSLRGLSWIVNPYKDGVVIALEIHSASAVAGPFRIREAELTAMVDRVTRDAGPVRNVH